MKNNNTYYKNSFFSYLSKIVPAIFSFIFTLIISNYLGPEMYGVYNYLPAVLIGFFSLFGGEFLYNLLWNFTSKTKSKEFFKKILLLILILAGIIFILINLFGPSAMQFIKAGHHELIPIASIFILLFPINAAFMTLFKGFSKFGKVFKAALIENTITLIFSIILIIYFGFGVEGAFISRFIALVFSITIYFREYKKIHFTKNKVNPVEIKKFITWNIISNFIRELNNQIFVISIGLFINKKLIGIYYLGEKISTIALSSPSSAISDALYSKNNENYLNKNIISRHTSLAIQINMIITIILGVIVFALTPAIVQHLFPNYSELLIFMPLMIISQIIQSQGPLFKIFDSINETKNNLKTNILFLILTISFIIPSTIYFGLLGLLIAAIISTEIRYITTIRILRKYDILINPFPTKTSIAILLKKIFSR